MLHDMTAWSGPKFVKEQTKQIHDNDSIRIENDSLIVRTGAMRNPGSMPELPRMRFESRAEDRGASSSADRGDHDGVAWHRRHLCRLPGSNLREKYGGCAQPRRWLCREVALSPGSGSRGRT